MIFVLPTIEIAATIIMDELPDELIQVIAGDCVLVIDALRAACGRFRRILTVPPLLVDGVDAAKWSPPATRDHGTKKFSLLISRGDSSTKCIVMLRFGFGVGWVKYFILEKWPVGYILRHQLSDFVRLVEMSRGNNIGGGFIGVKYSMSAGGLMRVYNKVLSPIIPCDCNNLAIIRASPVNIFPLAADTVLELSREDTRDTFLAVAVHTSRVPEFAALGWKLTGKLPEWL